MNYFSVRYSNNIRLFCMKKYLKKQYSKLATMSNKLGQEKSPYLLQHQHNPVHWQPWNEETIALAKNLGKPIFLSSGYSTCHWCHVMERESFENPNIANIMNEHFINIKLDREEHPDIDRIYMTFIQAMSGSGGWPMSVWLTPDLKPFYGGTYFPPEDRYFGRPGFRALLESIGEQWAENSDKCIESGNKILQVLEKTAILPVLSEIPSAIEVGKKCNSQLARHYEPTYGGFSEQPKFPQPVNIQFLIQYAKYEPNCFGMVDKTLRFMRKGGIYDHLGKGFCRYSTDKKWHVPHFEKMLYDQAQLTTVYLNAYLHSKDEFFAGVAQEILEYVSRDMSIKEGGFYSAEDADSLPTSNSTEKKEGAFYAWEKSEIETILNTSEKLSNSKSTTAAELFCTRYGIKSNGNVDPHQDPHDELKNKNVIYEAKDLEALAKEYEITNTEEIQTNLNSSKEILFNWRNDNRPRPHLDNKFITSWNGLMLSAYSQAGYILTNQDYINRALLSAEFIEKNLIRDGDLLRTCYSDRQGLGGNLINLEAPIFGCVDDFANVIGGFLYLFQATGLAKWLKLAVELQTKQNDLFWDAKTPGGYFTTRATDKNAILRMKDDDDGAEPSSNSTSLINLLRFEQLFPEKFNMYIKQIILQFGDRLNKVPITLPLMCTSLLSYETNGIGSYYIIGKNLSSSATSSSALVKTLKSKLLPMGSLVCPVDLGNMDNLGLLKTTVPLIQKMIDEEEYEKHFGSDGGGGNGQVVIIGKKINSTDAVIIKTVEELETFFNTTSTTTK